MHKTRQVFRFAAVALIGAIVPLSANAQDDEAATQVERQFANSNVIEEVQVRGQRMSEIEFDIEAYIREFIGEVVALPPGGGYARWDRNVCVGIHNLETTAAQYLADRISALIMSVGLEPGEPGCTPHVMILFTVDADELATAMVENNPRLFRPGGPVCCMQLGLDALDRFKTTDKPVRWWHVAMPVDTRLGQRAIPLAQDGTGNYPVIAVAGPSRIHNGVKDRLERVVIIVDATQIRGTTWQEIGDYLAFISLAQVDPQADPSQFDSILNLFSNPEAYSGLTDWDRTYVNTLYEISLNRYAGFQGNQLVNRMAKRERESAAE